MKDTDEAFYKPNYDAPKLPNRAQRRVQERSKQAAERREGRELNRLLREYGLNLVDLKTGAELRAGDAQ